MKEREIILELFRNQDKQYAALQKKILPTVDPERIIGVRTPELRSFARMLYGTESAASFLARLPHQYFDEDQLHAFIISLDKQFDTCIVNVEAFLPFIITGLPVTSSRRKHLKRNRKSCSPTFGNGFFRIIPIPSALQSEC